MCYLVLSNIRPARKTKPFHLNFYFVQVLKDDTEHYVDVPSNERLLMKGRKLYTM